MYNNPNNPRVTMKPGEPTGASTEGTLPKTIICIMLSSVGVIK